MNCNHAPLVVSILLSLLAAACGTTRDALEAVSEPLATAEQDGLSATLRFRDEASLIRQFGRRSNPFLAERYRVMYRRIIVFELTLQNESSAPYSFRLARCRLRFAGKEIGPINGFQLANYWQGLEAAAAQDKAAIVKRYLLPDRASAPSGSALSGFLVFQGNLPSSGEARVLIPGPVENGEPLRFDYVF